MKQRIVNWLRQFNYGSRNSRRRHNALRIKLIKEMEQKRIRTRKANRARNKQARISRKANRRKK